jgi:hypothetical protein
MIISLGSVELSVLRIPFDASDIPGEGGFFLL